MLHDGFVILWKLLRQRCLVMKKKEMHCGSIGVILMPLKRYENGFKMWPVKFSFRFISKCDAVHSQSS